MKHVGQPPGWCGHDKHSQRRADRRYDPKLAALDNAFGIRSIGSNVTVRVKDSSIVGNGVGLRGGGALLSGGNTTVQANASNGGFTGSYALQYKSNTARREKVEG